MVATRRRSPAAGSLRRLQWCVRFHLWTEIPARKRFIPADGERSLTPNLEPVPLVAEPNRLENRLYLVNVTMPAPALAQAGLPPDRVIYVEAGDEKSVLACFEEGLRHGGLGGVVAEVARLSMTASRRLQLAAESSGTIGVAIRRWRRQAEAADFRQPTASVTRWRVTALPSTPLPVPGVGRARWRLELIRCRAGESADFEVEACDGKGRLALPSDLAHGPEQKKIGRRRAAS